MHMRRSHVPDSIRPRGAGGTGMAPRGPKAQLAVTGMLVTAGAWLAASPLVAGYTRLQLVSWHNALAGLAIVVLTVLGHSGRPRRAPLALPLAVLAVWLLIAPWLLGYGDVLLRESEPGQATWNGMFSAAVVLAASALRTFLARGVPGEASPTTNAERT